MKKYILIGHTPVEEPDLKVWAEWYQYEDTHVASDEIGGVQISTVFLGLDHNFAHPLEMLEYGSAKPILFETMIFGGSEDGYMRRYATWEEAEQGHKKAVELVKSINQ